jgi:hypothetical protein
MCDSFLGEGGNVIKLRGFYFFYPLYRVAKEVVQRLSYDRVSQRSAFITAIIP